MQDYDVRFSFFENTVLDSCINLYRLSDQENLQPCNDILIEAHFKRSDWSLNEKMVFRMNGYKNACWFNCESDKKDPKIKEEYRGFIKKFMNISAYESVFSTSN